MEPTITRYNPWTEPRIICQVCNTPNRSAGKKSGCQLWFKKNSPPTRPIPDCAKSSVFHRLVNTFRCERNRIISPLSDSQIKHSLRWSPPAVFKSEKRITGVSLTPMITSPSLRRACADADRGTTCDAHARLRFGPTVSMIRSLHCIRIGITIAKTLPKCGKSTAVIYEGTAISLISNKISPFSSPCSKVRDRVLLWSADHVPALAIKRSAQILQPPE